MNSPTLIVRDNFILVRSPGYYPPVGLCVEFMLYDGAVLVGLTAVLYHGDSKNQVETVFVPLMSAKAPGGCRVYCADAVHSWHPIHDLPDTTWQPIDTVPTNTRVFVYDAKTDETAISWKDLIDGRFYYAPQGGILTFVPTHWRHLHDAQTA